MFIGDVELPIVSDIVNSSEANVDEIKPLKEKGNRMDSVPVKHEASVKTITILGFVNEEIHSQHYSIEEQKEDIKRLRKREKSDNSFDYGSYKGYLLVENVNFVDNGDSRIVNEVEIEARYFPWPKYHPENKP